MGQDKSNKTDFLPNPNPRDIRIPSFPLTGMHQYGPYKEKAKTCPLGLMLLWVITYTSEVSGPMI